MTNRERAHKIELISRTPQEIYEEIEQAITAAVEEEREAIMGFAVNERDGAQKLKGERSDIWASAFDWLIAYLCQRRNTYATENSST